MKFVAKRPSGVNVEDPAIIEAWNDVRSDDSQTNWLMLHLSGPTTIAVKSTGSGGIHELIDSLSDDEVLFCALRLSLGGQVKFFHIYFVGANVSPLKKGKISMLESGVFGALEGAHGKLTCSGGVEEFTTQNVAEQIFKITKVPVEL